MAAASAHIVPMLDFDTRTRKILKTARQGRIGIRPFERCFPEITQQLRLDADSRCFDLWGQSQNVDEFENQKIVDPKLLTVIGRIAGYPIRNKNAYHAGLIHTYGYLLSHLKTRFGYKRQRWTEGQIELGLGIPSGLFSADPPTGTLLQNVTWLMARIAIQPTPSSSWLTSRLPDVSSGPFAFSSRRHDTTRILEFGRQRIQNQRPKRVELLTDLVYFERPTATATALLVYSYRLGKIHKLVTCFPVDEDFCLTLIGETKANALPIRPRYNLFLDGWEPAVKREREIEKRLV